MAAPGTFPNTTSELFVSGVAVAAPATPNLLVEPPPTFAKVFAPDTLVARITIKRAPTPDLRVTVENLEPAPLQALRYSGARRSDLIVTAVWPLSIGRWLTYFFYRFETCVRESTALGMLGIASLGYWISDAQANHYYDEVFFFVGLSGLIVVAADFASARARRSLREGS